MDSIIFIVGILCCGLAGVTLIIIIVALLGFPELDEENPQAKFSKAKALIASAGGNDTLATVVGYLYHHDDLLLNYTYMAIMPDGKEKNFEGSISTALDVLHAPADYEWPNWMEKYTKGYKFPIRYLKSDPRIHYPIEEIDFRS
jgi:hypothetical protein